jgi:hypothetical protein
MTRYSVFDQLAELTQLTKNDRGYAKFVQTGNIEFHDYGRGFFDVDVYSFMQPLSKQWTVRIWLGTIDDGDYGGWQDAPSKEVAENLVDQIAHNVFADMVAFPTLDELNKMLRPYGIAVGYE